MSRYSWGVDGFGRAFIDKDRDCQIIFCLLPGNSGGVGVDLLEEQDKREMANKTEPDRNPQPSGD